MESGLLVPAEYLDGHLLSSIALPALGCGNGGLDWQQVKSLIERLLGHMDMKVTVYEPQ